MLVVQSVRCHVVHVEGANALPLAVSHEPIHLSFHPDVVDVRDNRHRGLCLEHGPGSFEVDQVVACQQRDTLCTVQGERGQGRGVPDIRAHVRRAILGACLREKSLTLLRVDQKDARLLGSGVESLEKELPELPETNDDDVVPKVLPLNPRGPQNPQPTFDEHARRNQRCKEVGEPQRDPRAVRAGDRNPEVEATEHEQAKRVVDVRQNPRTQHVGSIGDDHAAPKCVEGQPESGDRQRAAPDPSYRRSHGAPYRSAERTRTLRVVRVTRRLRASRKLAAVR